VFCYDKQRGNTVFQYDPTGRILNAKGRTEEFFEFDPAGNMQPKGLGAYTVPGNRLEVFEDLRYEYDVHGNVSTRKKGVHEEAEFTWNAEHQLKEAKVTRKGTTQTTRYEYDALGRRTRKIDAFGATEYLWDGDLMIESRRNNKQALFLFEPGSFVPLATVQDEKTYWYQCDQVGALQELTDKEGQIVWAADYRVWGETKLRKIGTDGAVRYAKQPEPPPVLEQPFRFQGQQFDEETGLHYNRHRYYDPGIGRFVSQDPIGLRGGGNLFAYAPNPLRWVDPFGLANTQNNPSCPSCTKSAAENLPQMKGNSVAQNEKILSQNGFNQTQVSNSAAKNQTWSHADGSEVRIHPYGNQNQAPFRSANNAHIHKQASNGAQLTDRGIVSTNPAQTHIGIRNPADLPQVRGRPHGAGTQ
jgi:RHS repeat-associated protein